MDSRSHPKLPIITFNEKTLSRGTSSWKSTSDSVRRALESYGCFVVAHEKMSSELHKAMFGSFEELFHLPLETKKKHICKIPGSGYGANFPVMPLFEYFGIPDGPTIEAAKNFTRVIWPDGNDIFCEATFSYSKVLMELHEVVVELLVSSYGLEKYYEPVIGSTFYLTRLMRYKSAGENERSIGLISHRDKSFLAVLGTNEVCGLEIETRDGLWIDYEPSPSSFIVIVGEALMAWSNGRLYCPLHRVVVPKGIKEKYSVALFTLVRGMLQVPDELVDNENPLKFKSFSNFEFLEYCKDGGQKMNGAIQEYCGI